MKKQLRFYLGMDVSKLWVDITLMCVADHQKQPVVSERFDNNAAGMKAFGKWMKKYKVSLDENSLLVIENTGVYHRLVWEYCSKLGLPLHIGNATRIKYSFGIARGKNDKIDSQRLCAYAFKNADELQATPPLNPVFITLKDMMTSRSRLLAQQNSIMNLFNFYFFRLPALVFHSIIVASHYVHRHIIWQLQPSVTIAFLNL